MNPAEDLHARLLRLLDGRADPAERAALEVELRSDPAARAALRALAEQAVMVADLERTAAARHREAARVEAPVRPGRARIWALAAAAGLVLALGASTLWLRAGGREVGRVVKVTGAGSYFGTRGAATAAVRAGIRLRAGDTLETRSCDSWIEIELRDGTHLTLAGQSMLRLLAPRDGVLRLELPRGNLWSAPASDGASAQLSVRTASATLESRGTQFDVQSGSGQALVRVNGGMARAIRTVDGSAAELSAGQQAVLTLVPGEDAGPVPQPAPVTSWASDLGGVPEVLLGRWLPPRDLAGARLAAVPILWPIPERPPITLHAVALSVLRGPSQPVLLKRDSRIRFHGQTLRPMTVRFGFSTQRMRGVFAGKFELDVPASELGEAGQPWEVDRPVGAFLPLRPELAATPEGLELYDLYALTVQEDAGLELRRVEVLSGPAEDRLP